MTQIVTNLEELRKKSEPVNSVEEAISILKELRESLKKTDNGIGLAACQIGINKRVGIINRTIRFTKPQDNEVLELINPVFVSAEEEMVYFNEGCLSFPGKYLNTKRFKHYIIKNNIIVDGKFEEQTLYFYYSTEDNEPGNSGTTAIAVQHEMDHFEGVLFTDKEEKSIPIVKNAKIGRNDPCPCGAKKANGEPIKYKKCCGK